MGNVKKPSKYGAGKGIDREDRKRQFARIRKIQTNIVENNLKIIRNSPELQKFYSKILTTFRVKGKGERMKAVKKCIEETKKFAEENSMDWRL